MGRLGFFVFLFLGAISSIGIDVFGQMSTAKAQDPNAAFGPKEYFATVKSRYAAYKSDLKRHDMADYMPAPAGWAVRDLTDEDLARLMAPPKPLTPEQEKIAAVEEAMKREPAMMLVQASVSRGFKQEIKVYEKGDAMVAVRMKFVPSRVFEGVGGPQLAMMQDIMNLEHTLDGEDDGPFAVVAGLPFKEEDETENPSRDIRAELGRQFSIRVLALATDEEIFEVISDFDIANLNAMMLEPATDIGVPGTFTHLASLDPVEESA
ncbi:MAG: hypothetical protein AAGP08_03540, partial [Pseudomonadota bacterium]